MPKKRMHLGYAMYNDGRHPASWKANPRDTATDIKSFARQCQIAEAAKLDMIFRADVPFARMTNIQAWSRDPFNMNIIEPLTLFSALSQHTTRIGLAGTISTTFNEPYNIARQLAALDHLSGGRAAWNVVTSFSAQAARNFGMSDMPPPKERYERAREFVNVVKALWDTYEDDAIIHDREAGYYFDPDKFHPVDFDGKYIQVHGALNIARCPQGYPVLIQAGNSADGRQFAAETAEVIFTGGASKDKLQAFYVDMRSRVVAAGRSVDELKILPGLTVVLGDSKAEAQAKYEAMDAKISDEVKLQHLADDIGVKLSGLPLDKPIPEELLPSPSGSLITAYFNRIADMVRQGVPLREMLRHYRRTSGDLFFGTPAEIADIMEELIEDNACDGFNMMFPAVPACLEDFCKGVVPELQRRGSFRKEYEGTTLREHFGLPRPANRHVAS